MSFGSITIPAEIVSVLGGATVIAVSWQIRLTVKLLGDVAVLRSQLDFLVNLCPLCKQKT